MTLPLDSIVEFIEPLASEGVTFHWLWPKTKKPMAEKWAVAACASLNDLRRTHESNANIGIRLGEPSKVSAGYVYLIDLDVRDPEKEGEARSILADMLPGYDKLPTVISGSGGASRHFYFASDKPFRSKKLAHSSGSQMVWDAKKGREVKKFHWEIEFFGTGKQAVVPPSIHPDTGRPYEWLVEFDFNMVALGVWPTVPSSVIEAWGLRGDGAEDFDDDAEWLMSEVVNEPIGLEHAEIQRIVDDLPSEWVDDRDEWYKVGMALHHELRGDDAGFEMWCAWSQQSEKFDEKDQRRVWNSFGKNTRAVPVRMPSLIKASRTHRLASEQGIEDAEFEDIPFDEPEDDILGELLGESTPTAAEEDPLLGELLGPATAAPQKSKPIDGDVITPNRNVLAYDENWRSLLKYSDEGGIKTTYPNTRLIVRNDPRWRGCIAFNEFRQEVVQITLPRKQKRDRERPKPMIQLGGRVWELSDKLNGKGWTDSHDNWVRAILEAPTTQGGYELSKVPDRDIKAAIDMVAQENAFHPVKDYLETLEWDGVPRIETLFHDYLNAPDDPYHREVAVMMMMGAVARIYCPGHKFDFVVILEGPQGKGKSSFIKLLAKFWGGELAADFHDTQKMVESMQSKWLLEIPELQGFSRADVTTLKSFVSIQNDRTRLAYERRARDFPRQCIFIGTTNDGEYLRDDTGGRRFWIVKTALEAQIDRDRLRENTDQLWAEAVVMFKQMQETHGAELPLFLRDPEAIAKAEVLQEGARIVTAEESNAGEIQEWLDTPLGAAFEDKDDEPPRYRNQVCAKEVWCEMWRRDPSQFDNRQTQIVNRALRQIPGWSLRDKKCRVPGYGIQRVFVRNVPHHE